MSKSPHLKKFSADELILDESETRIVLQFFWPEAPTATRIQESLTITDPVRELAQALLVEAIDASYQVGFIEAIFRATANPTSSTVKVIKSFGRRAASHWFRHARASDLQNTRVYEFIRKDISRYFSVVLYDYLNGFARLDSNQLIVARLFYSNPPAMPKVWG